MRKTNFTFLSLVLTMMVYFGTYSSVQAQCDAFLDCIDKVNISMTSTPALCTRTILPGDVMPPNAAAACAGATVMVIHKYSDPSNLVTIADSIGWDLVYKVIDPLTQNSCWGYIRVEDKAPPRLVSGTDTLPCVAFDESKVNVATDNCATSIYGATARITFISKRWIDYTCAENPEFSGIVIRNYRAFDLWNNSSTMTDTLWIERLNLAGDSLICPPNTLVDCAKKVDLGSGPVDILWSSLFVDGPVLNGVTYRVPKPTKGPNSYDGNNPSQS